MNAPAMKAYMKNHFEFLGIKSLERKILLREFIREYGLPNEHEFESVIFDLWRCQFREIQYCAMETIQRAKYSKLEKSISLNRTHAD